MKILLLENIHPVAVESLKNKGYTIDLLKEALSPEDLSKKLKDYQMLGIRSKTQVPEQVIASNPHLLSIGAFCIGTNQIDTSTAYRAGIPVFNAPYANTRSVAELVICEIIGLARKVFLLNQKAQQGIWQKSASSSFEVRGKVLGIVGYGHIGSQVSILAEALGLQVYYYDVLKKLPLGNSKPLSSLSSLLSISDFITLHVPETPQTTNMIGAAELSSMKKGSYIINASRGSVIDLEALAENILSKHIAGAALDVFPIEPSSNADKFESPLQGLDNVILTPHIGGSTEEAQEAIGKEVADSFIKFIETGSTQSSVNFPQADLPLSENSSRMINIHKNVPGVLSEINKIVSSMGININSQYLATNPEIGYLIMDVEKANAQGFSDQIEKLATSIKTRLIS